MKRIWLSHSIDNKTPLYGGRRENFHIYKTSAIVDGKIANETRIETTVHLGTHIDMPYHFHNDGQTVHDFDIDFWFFYKPLVISLKPNNYIIEDDLISNLNIIRDEEYDILIVKTDLCHDRDKDQFWQQNYGFSPKIYDYLIKNFPSIRVLGFDSISISSWQNRDLGKIAHKVFLNPKKPILLLEDMNLVDIDVSTQLLQIIIAPMRLEECDGCPCTVYGIVEDE